MDHKVTSWNSVGKYFSYHILKINTVSIPSNIQYTIRQCTCYPHTLLPLIEKSTCPLCDFSLYTFNSKGSQLPFWLVWFLLLLFGLGLFSFSFFIPPNTHRHTYTPLNHGKNMKHKMQKCSLVYWIMTKWNC